LKIILNGKTIQSELVALCYQVDETEASELPYDEGIKMVELLNKAEDLVFKAKRIFLESQGFNGPWPKSLQ
jgi:hypothetical protein